MTQDSTLNKGTKIGLKHEEKIIQPEEIHHILKPGELGAVLELIVSDPNTIDPLTGKPKITEHRVIKSKSFVQQFLQLLFAKMVLASTVSPVANVRDTSNSLRDVKVYDIAVFDVNAAVTVATYGIIIGDDDGTISPLNINNYAIGNIIPHATMNYSIIAFGTPAADTTTSQFTVTRTFTNVSGGGITVNEVALYCRAKDAGGTVRYFMTIRDIIAGGIAVPNGQTLTVNYRQQVVI